MAQYRSRWEKLAVPAALILMLSACGGDDSGETTTAAPTTVATTTSAPPPTTAPTTTMAPTTTISPTTTTIPTTTTSLPGDPIDIGPRAGDVLAVVGVAHDDVLNVRAAPGTDQPIVTTMDPLEDGVVALGNARLLPGSIWYEIEIDGVTGWSSSAFLAYLGDTGDVTSSLIASLGETPVAETMLDLGTIVAEALASDDPPSRIAMSVAPSVGDLGEVTFDVIGLGDDALFGVRLHVFGTPTEGGEGFSLKSVEQTLLCGRGVSDGLCV